MVLALIAVLALGIAALFIHDSYRAKTAATRLRGRGNIHTYRVEADENAEYEGYRAAGSAGTTTQPEGHEQNPNEMNNGENAEDPEKTVYRRR